MIRGELMGLNSSFVNDLLLKEVLLEKNSVKDIDASPCIADPNRIKYTAKIGRNLDDVLPVLFLATLNSRLTRDPVMLSFTTQQHNFLLGEKGGLAVTFVKDKEEIQYINDKVIELINKAIKYRLTNHMNLEKFIEKKKKITPLSLYDILPKTDCRACSENTCFNYAAKILTGEARLDACPYLEHGVIRRFVTPVNLAWSLDLSS
ncbi:hypothetical protein E4H04_04215 [Candidatus Bathyarchaeota archaeon]|nr:MAG: hypothetical protein E4H04_04215 [Candidatus Bathyarchaeota archaeon]